MKNKFLKYTKRALLIQLLLGCGVLVHAQMNPKVKLSEALGIIEKNYVDPVNDEVLADAAIKGMIAQLDPHSTYLSREQAEALNSSMSGSFAGIGIQFAMMGDSTFVTGITFDGPAANAGLKQGDRIIEVDGRPITGRSLKNQDVMQLLRGEKGTQVKLLIVRIGQPNPILINITRAQIAELSITSSYMVDAHIGYISLSIFSQSTRREMDEALKRLKSQGMNKLILDLQGNGGGLVEAAIGVADEFLAKEKLIFYSVTNTGVKDNYYTGGFGQFMQGMMVVLLDESTASSSEILSGSLQDWDRAVLIGRRSFGKGLMQRSYSMADGSVLRLTGARYYTPSGRSIQKPFGKGQADYFADLNHRLESGELLEVGHYNFPDSLKFNTLQSKRTVFGGGGIMPDIFVPIDTTLYSGWMSALVGRGFIAKEAFSFVQHHRDSLIKQYPSFETFNLAFHPGQESMMRILDEAAVAGISLPDRKLTAGSAELLTELKAQVAAQLFTGQSYSLRVRNESSQAFKKAVTLLNNSSEYQQLLHLKVNHKKINIKK